MLYPLVGLGALEKSIELPDSAAPLPAVVPEGSMVKLLDWQSVMVKVELAFTPDAISRSSIICDNTVAVVSSLLRLLLAMALLIRIINPAIPTANNVMAMI